MEIESQMALANLLMAHTHNIQEARQRLDRAVRPSHLPTRTLPALTVVPLMPK